MKKVKMNESQLRHLVRGMIRETYGDDPSERNLSRSNRAYDAMSRSDREEEMNYGDPDAMPRSSSRPAMSASDAAYKYRAPSEAVGTYNIMLNNYKKRFESGEHVDFDQVSRFFDQYSQTVYGGDAAATVSALLGRANLPAKMKRALVDWEETKGY